MNQKQRREDRANPDFFYIPIAKKDFSGLVREHLKAEFGRRGRCKLV